MKRVLVLDIDGTLVNSRKEITPATRQAIWDILDRGHKVILASGRPLPGMKRYEKELELAQRGGYLLSFNGAKVVDCKSGKTVYQELLPLSIVPGLYEYAKKQGCGLITFLGENSISAFSPDEYVEYEARLNGITVRVVENWPEFVNFPIHKCILTAPEKKAAVCEKELQEKFKDVVNIFRSDPYFIEVVPKGVDKALSLEKLLAKMGFEREQSVCCGDGFNDISMLRFAGVGVAMGNAQPQAKEVADYITATNDEDGIVEVIQKYFQIQLPSKVKYIIDTITGAGFEAYAVGGCIRDSILGREPNDWDITTSATPRQVKALFRRTIDTGIAHGTVTVMLDKEGFEVTTYRIDGEYEDSRHPREVIFTPNLVEDLKRRDFTMNAMAYNDTAGLVDVFGGLEDIRQGVIRCVGNAGERFTEDALRILRAIRFSAQLGYTIEEDTKAAITKLAGNLRHISAERIREELTKLLVSPHPDYLEVAYETGVTAVVLPEFDKCMETPQKHKHHCRNVGGHILCSLKHVPPQKELRFAMLFHDMGKPQTLETDDEGVTHFHGHAKVSARMAGEIMKRLRFDNDTLFTVRRLVEYHDLGNGVDPDLRMVRRAVNKVGEDIFPLLCQVRRADVLAQSEYRREEKLSSLEKWESLYREILEKEQCLSLKTLAVTGSDLIALGMQPGKEIGNTLKELLEYVLDDPQENRKEILLKKVEERMQKS